MALTTLANAKQYIYLATQVATTDDALLTSLINQLSGAILDFIQRPKLFKNTYTELRSGVGNQTMTLRNYPVLSVSSVTVSDCYGATKSIPAATSFGQTGYTVSIWDGTYADNPEQVTLSGFYFWRGRNNVQIVYSAGYAVQNELYTVTSGTSSGIQKYTALQPLGTWGQDDGVFYSSGSSLVALSSGNQPSSAGQYLVTNGVYQFSTADAGQQLNINYSFIPSAVEQACIQWVAERYSYLSRIGQKTKSLGGNESASYDMSAMPSYVALMLNPYCKWLPI